MKLRGNSVLLQRLARRLGLEQRYGAARSTWLGTRHRGEAEIQRSSCVDDYVLHARAKGLPLLEATSLRARSTQLRDVLAHGTSNGKCDYATLVSQLEAYRDPSRRRSAERAVRRFDVPWLLSTARVVGKQRVDQADAMNAVMMYELVAELSAAAVRNPKDGVLRAQLAYVTRDLKGMRELLGQAELDEDSRAYLEADLINPFTGEASGDEEQWLATVNALFGRYDLEPIELLPGGDRPAFDRLSAKPRALVQEGPLVSVIMTAYMPDQRLDAAIRSVLEQSWRALELLVVDDGTPAEHQAALDRWEGADPRLKIVRNPENRGTYVARNDGLDHATGEFVTFADSDDWSHPARIQRQVEPLIADDTLVMSRSVSVRTSEALEFTWLGYSSTRFNASSLLFRRERVMRRIGYFDSVRKSADSEYHQRIKLAFPSGDIDLGGAPQAWVRMRTDTLSRSDFFPGWHAPARVAYRNAYEHWHRQIRGGRSSPYLPNEQHPRVFPAPRSFAPVREQKAIDYDVLFLSDWRSDGDSQRAMAEEIRTLRDADRAVGIVQLESPWRLTVKMVPPAEPIQDLINSGVVDQVALDEGIHARLVVIRPPSVLQYVPATPVRVKADHMLVVVDQPPHQADGTRHRYDIEQCRANLRSLFVTEATWVPHGATERGLISPLLPDTLLAPFDKTDDRYPEFVRKTMDRQGASE